VSRLVATMWCDVRLQMRNGFYWAVAFLLTMLLVLVSQLPSFDWVPVLPPLVLGNLAVATFFFIAGLILLEKGEGTLEAQVVTPLTEATYLTSKIVTLTALSIVESIVIVLVTNGLEFRPLPLVVGIVLTATLYCLAGFLAVVRYDSINEFLFPTMIWVTLFSLPILHYAGLWSSPLMYLHPFQAPLVILKGAFNPLRPWEWIYGIGYATLWSSLAFFWSRRAFRRFVVAKSGGLR
jgi:fluoroquinolone transport system permease protein